MATHTLVPVLLFLSGMSGAPAAHAAATEHRVASREVRAPETSRAALPPELMNIKLLSSVVTLGAPAAAGIVAAAMLWTAAGLTWTFGGTRVRAQDQSPLMPPMRNAWLVLLWSGAAVGVASLIGVAAAVGVGSALALGSGGA